MVAATVQELKRSQDIIILAKLAPSKTEEAAGHNYIGQTGTVQELKRPVPSCQILMRDSGDRSGSSIAKSSTCV